MVIEPGQSNYSKGVGTNTGGKVRAAGDANASSSADKTPPASGDSVSLSGTARLLGELQAKINDTDAVRADKVESLRSAIDNGSYEANGQAIASAILSQDGGL